MLAYQVSTPGGPDALKMLELPDPEPREDWVKIRVRAFGLNRSEMYTRQGHSGDAVPFPRVLGLECVGEVLDGGGTDLTPGQKVCAVMGGLGRRYDEGYAEMTLPPRAQVLPVETALPWDVLGALPETWFTAWLSVFDVLEAEPGQRILIRGGTSAAGMAAAEYSQASGRTYHRDHALGEEGPGPCGGGRKRCRHRWRLPAWIGRPKLHRITGRITLWCIKDPLSA